MVVESRGEVVIFDGALHGGNRTLRSAFLRVRACGGDECSARTCAACELALFEPLEVDSDHLGRWACAG